MKSKIFHRGSDKAQLKAVSIEIMAKSFFRGIAIIEQSPFLQKQKTRLPSIYRVR